MKYLILAIFLCGCSELPPQLNDNPYQQKAIELVTQYNAKHGTSVPVPPVRIAETSNLDEGEAYCPVHASGCWLIINESLDNQRHGIGYAMSNSLPHEVAHHICVYLKKCPRGNYHGPEWQEIATELGLHDDFFIH